MADDNEYYEFLHAFALGCLDKEDYNKLLIHFQEGGEYNWRDLGEYQNLASLLPSILNIEVPSPQLKDKVARKLYRLKEEIKVRDGRRTVERKKTKKPDISLPPPPPVKAPEKPKKKKISNEFEIRRPEDIVEPRKFRISDEPDTIERNVEEEPNYDERIEEEETFREEQPQEEETYEEPVVEDDYSQQEYEQKEIEEPVEDEIETVQEEEPKSKTEETQFDFLEEEYKPEPDIDESAFEEPTTEKEVYPEPEYTPEEIPEEEDIEAEVKEEPITQDFEVVKPTKKTSEFFRPAQHTQIRERPGLDMGAEEEPKFAEEEKKTTKKNTEITGEKSFTLIGQKKITWIIAGGALLVILIAIIIGYFSIRSDVEDYQDRVESLNKELANITSQKEAREDVRNILESKNPVILNLQNTRRGNPGSARLIMSLDESRGYLQISDMPPVREGRAYQLWINVPGKYISLGVFKPVPETRYYPFSLPEINENQNIQFILTEETASGAAWPGRQILFTGRL